MADGDRLRSCLPGAHTESHHHHHHQGLSRQLLLAGAAELHPHEPHTGLSAVILACLSPTAFPGNLGLHTGRSHGGRWTVLMGDRHQMGQLRCRLRCLPSLSERVSGIKSTLPLPVPGSYGSTLWVTVGDGWVPWVPVTHVGNLGCLGCWLHPDPALAVAGIWE